MLPLSCIISGFLVVLVGYTSSVAIVFQAAAVAGASPDEISSWLVVLGLGMGITTLCLSLYYRAPIVTAWSTPGAALLVTSLSGTPLPEATGAFLFCGALVALSGFSGLFERLVDRIPISIATAMLAGILTRFCLNAFVSAETALLLVLLMFLVFLFVRRFALRYATLASLITGIVVANFQGLMNFNEFTLTLSGPVLVTPSFSLPTLIGIGVPLFIVTMASQNVPGVAALRNGGYSHVPTSPLITWTGVTTIVLAPFGGYTFNLAAITAAICISPEAHKDETKRYLAATCAGGFYIVIGVFGATVAAIFAVFPAELILAIAGFALLNTISGALHTAISDIRNRDSALITFLITLSGVSLWGIDAAFWGLIAGGLSWLLLNWDQAQKN